MTNTTFRFNGIAMSAEVLNYIYSCVDEQISDEAISLRLWEKANPYAHLSSFPREELREVLRQITGRSHYHKILHHAHLHRNLQDVIAIADFARSLYIAINRQLN